MWLKLCLLVVYILLLFILSRILEAVSWLESGYSGALSRQLLDPVVLSVARLKALLEQRGVSYEGVIDKSELTSLVETSGQVNSEEVELSQLDETSTETNFTSGAHFIEQVEDAKDSVWLVQVVSSSGRFPVVSSSRWKAIRKKVSKFGVRTGFFDCSLDMRYCSQRGWKYPFLLLALPGQFEKKADIAMYNYTGSVKENAVFHWLRDKLNERVQRIRGPISFYQNWQNFSSSALEPEIRAVMFTRSTSAPLFYSALSVKFPGRVKFGLVSFESPGQLELWKQVLNKEKINNFPAYMIYTAEKKYTYGLHAGELFNFPNMERFFKFLYPCLNDVFIISFCVANILSWFEIFISNCSFLKRLRKFVWCMFKYNIAVIMLWLPVIGIFQMPYLDRIPLLALKMVRIFSTSYFGTMLRGDCHFYLSNPVYVCISFGIYLALITFLCKKYRQADHSDDNWFNLSQMRTHAYLRPNDIFEPVRISGYELLGGLDVFGSYLSQPSLWLQPSISHDYIKHLPTWQYCPVPLARRAAEITRKVEIAMNVSDVNLATCSDAAKSTQVYPNDGQFEDMNLSGKTSQTFGQETDQGLCPSLAQATSTGSRMQSIHKCSDSQKCCIASKSSVSINGPINLLNSCQEIFNHPSSSSISVQNHTCLHVNHTFLHTDVRHPAMSSEASRTTYLSDNKVQPCRSEVLDHLTNKEALTKNATQSLQVHSTQSETTCNSTQRNPKPPSPDPARESPKGGSGFPAGYLESHHCVICLDEYAVQTMLCGLPCGHVFHETCIISWFNREKHFCPMCRWPSYKRHHSQGRGLSHT